MELIFVAAIIILAIGYLFWYFKTRNKAKVKSPLISASPCVGCNKDCDCG